MNDNINAYRIKCAKHDSEIVYGENVDIVTAELKKFSNCTLDFRTLEILGGMTTDQEHHLQSIKDQFAMRMDEKYRKGQAEHGGNMWEKSGMIDNAIEEVLDMAAYLFTLKAQIEKIKTVFDKKNE